MASLESALFTALTASAGGLYTLVAARVYPEVMPQGASLPCLVYSRVSTPRFQALGATQAVVVSRPRFQFTCWALTASSAIDVVAALRTQLLATSYAVTLESESVMRDPDSNLHRRDLDAFIAHAGQ